MIWQIVSQRKIMSPKGLPCHTFTELIIVCFPSLDISSMGVPVKCETKRNKSKRNRNETKSKRNEVNLVSIRWISFRFISFRFDFVSHFTGTHKDAVFQWCLLDSKSNWHNFHIFSSFYFVFSQSKNRITNQLHVFNPTKLQRELPFNMSFFL